MSELAVAVALAEAMLVQVIQVLDPFLAALTEKERRALLRPPLRFSEAALVLADLATAEAPDLAKRAEFDPDAVREDITNATALATLAALAAKLTGCIDDSRLLWRAEAYHPSLRLYRVAKAVAADDGHIASIVAPMEEVFAHRRTPEPPAPTET